MDTVLSHPFLSGNKAARMVGEEPEWDVFISYRVRSDFAVAQLLHDELTELGLKVWWVHC